MTEGSGPRRLLFVSTSAGEDSVAAEIIRRLPPGFIVEAYPAIGEGTAYHGLCAIVGPRALPPRWRRARFSVPHDFGLGNARAFWPGVQFLRRVRKSYNRVIVVGDIAALAGCWAAGIGDLVFLDLHRTGHGRPYTALERQLIGRTAALVFCRHEDLAAALRADGRDARSVGNVLMDCVPHGDYDAMSRRTRPTAVTLLPGSRAGNSESFALQINALRALPPEDRPDIFLAVAGSVSIDDLARAAKLHRSGLLTGQSADLSTLRDEQLTVHMAHGSALGNLIEASDIVLSQADTATVQAVGLGRPVISFRTFRDRGARYRDEQGLYGIARIVTLPDVQSVSQALRVLLFNADERARIGALGAERVGGAGAIQDVVDAIVG